MAKFLHILAVLLLAWNVVFAQDDIVAMEYYIDNDPGQGMGTTIPVSSGQSIDINITIPISGLGLTLGTHLLVIRAQNSSGEWSMYEVRKFIIAENVDITPPPPPNITEVEYIIDEDAGVGNGASSIVPAAQTIDVTDLIDVASLSNGFHSISYRAKDGNNRWGFYETRIFYLQSAIINNPTPENMVEIEYYFDEDPGQGNAIPLTITPGQLLDIQTMLPNSLSSGFHVVGVRAQDALGNWGFAETRVVYVNQSGTITTPTQKITDLEYFYGDDPGYGNGTIVPIEPDATDIDIASLMLPSAADIPIGTNTISFRARNEDGLFGFAETREFEVVDDCNQPLADFSVNLACAGEIVEFIDNSTSVQGDAAYRWYLNGDAIMDDMTTGNTSFSYTNPGTYDVSLAIRQGQICYDSIGTTITIKPKPIVVFNADRVQVGNPTNYTVDQFNIDGTFNWAWDFETDATVDDNTAGNTSFTFPSVSAFLTTVNVSDGAGCETTFSRSITVDPIATGGGPAANFQTSTVCLGEPTIFTDLSSDIPPGATYAWDFNNDGSVDDNTTGGTQFTYSTAGDYTAMLTIDTGSETITSAKIARVVAYPTADFSTTTVCEGEVTNFSDLTSNASGTASYSWDFDGDGTQDSNTSSNANFTYPSSGNYTAVLTVNNGSGCVNTRIKSVQVIPIPAVDFSFVSGCVGSASTFSNQSTSLGSSATYSWDFDNDGFEDSDLANPQHTFSTPGTYPVTLIIDNGSGCQSLQTQDVIINSQPVVGFDMELSCNSTSVDFIDTSQNIASSPTYSWDFNNDGVIDSNSVGDVRFDYGSAGNYIASLVINNGSGCAASILKTVTINETIVASFNVESACVGETARFINTSSNAPTSTQYSWDFDGDGVEDSNSINPTRVFNMSGAYTVTLTAHNLDGCSDIFTTDIDIVAVPVVDFQISSSCPGSPVVFTNNSTGVEDGAMYEWDFTNDGSIDSNAENNESFTYPGSGPYSVSLSVTNNGECSTTLVKQVVFENSPIANFSFSNSCLGEATVFSDETTGSINSASYSWDFDGDGIPDSNIPGSTSFEYASPGTYTVQLTVSNNGCEDQISKEIEIYSLPEIELEDTFTICEGETVTLDPGPGYAEYLWSDGSTNQSLVVDTEGIYSLSVKDENGCSDSKEIEVLKSLLPSADFDVTYSITENDITIITNNLSENADTFSWDFGDGSTSSDINPIHTYSDLNILFGAVYEVCLTTTNSCESVSYCESINLTITEDLGVNELDIQVYPNPSSGKIHISIPEHLLSEHVSINIYSLTGQEVWNTKSRNSVVEVVGLKKGSYFIHLQGTDISHIQKLIVK